MIERFGLRVSNPDKPVQIDGQSFAELILYQHLHSENLRRVVAMLNQLNKDGVNEQIADIQINLQALLNTSVDALHDYLRIAQAQGLHFETAPTSGGVH